MIEINAIAFCMIIIGVAMFSGIFGHLAGSSSDYGLFSYLRDKKELEVKTLELKITHEQKMKKMEMEDLKSFDNLGFGTITKTTTTNKV